MGDRIVEKLRSELWSPIEIDNLYGVGPLANFQTGASLLPGAFKAWEARSGYAIVQKGEIHRAHFLAACADLEVIPIRSAAASYGMEEGSYRALMSAFMNRGWLYPEEIPYHGFVPDRKHRRFFPRHSIHPGQYGWYRTEIHGEWEKLFPSLIIKPVSCPVRMACEGSRWEGLEEDHEAQLLDSVTGEPVCEAHSISVESALPISVTMDKVSWATYEKYRDQLGVWGGEHQLPEHLQPTPECNGKCRKCCK